MQKFEFDYDPENDDLFIYKGSSRSKGGIEINDMIIDLDEKGNLAALEFLNATKTIHDFGVTLTKNKLADLTECKIEWATKKNWLFIKILFVFAENQKTEFTIPIPTVRASSPALSYA